MLIFCIGTGFGCYSLSLQLIVLVLSWGGGGVGLLSTAFDGTEEKGE